jgi:hypothetical protein
MTLNMTAETVALKMDNDPPWTSGRVMPAGNARSSPQQPAAQSTASRMCQRVRFQSRVEFTVTYPQRSPLHGDDRAPALSVTPAAEGTAMSYADSIGPQMWVAVRWKRVRTTT